MLTVDTNVIGERLRPRANPAAAVEQQNLTQVTRNTHDFEGCGIGLLNPFTE